MDLGPRDMRVRLHERTQLGLLRQVIQEGDGVDARDGERMRGDIDDPLTAGIHFKVPTDKAVSILITGLDKHAQPSWRMSAKATLAMRTRHVPLTLTLSQRARGLGKLSAAARLPLIALDSGAAMPQIPSEV